MSFKHKKDEIIEILKESLKLLLNNDSNLLKNDTHEIAINCKLAYYLSNNFYNYCLSNNFDNYDVDIEYNRDNADIKRIKSSDSEKLCIIRPDIIVHKRSENINLLVIEVKKNPSDDEIKNDIDKLKSLIQKYNYNYAVFINFNTDSAKCKLMIMNEDREISCDEFNIKL